VSGGDKRPLKGGRDYLRHGRPFGWPFGALHAPTANAAAADGHAVAAAGR
jgi:hypothetical protein